MRTNKSLLKKKRIKKALISIPTLTLDPEEADRFLDYVIDQSVLKNSARIVKMPKSEKRIRALGLGTQRVLYPHDQFDSAKYKKTFIQNTITLKTTKFRGCVVIFDDDLEDIQTIESDQEFTNHIMKMVTADIANQLAEAYWIGDTHGHSGFDADDIRSKLDGWRYIITHSAEGQDYYNDVIGAATILDASNGGDDFKDAGKIAEQDDEPPYGWEFKFAKQKKALPSIYKAKGGLAALRYITSDQVVDDFIEALAARATVLGDQAILGAEKGLRYGQVPIVPMPLMPTTLDADGKLDEADADHKYTDSVLTHFKNFIIGLQREIKLETERQAADEANYFFYSMRTDCKMENVNAVSMIKNLTIGC